MCPVTGNGKGFMRGLKAHPVEHLLRRLAECVCRRPAWFVYPQLVLFIVSAIGVDTNINLLALGLAFFAGGFVVPDRNLSNRM